MHRDGQDRQASSVLNALKLVSMLKLSSDHNAKEQTNRKETQAGDLA